MMQKPMWVGLGGSWLKAIKFRLALAKNEGLHYWGGPGLDKLKFY